MKTQVLLILIFFLLIGCDVIRGVGRGAYELSQAPSDDCIVHAVDSIDGISNVEYKIESGGKPLTLHGIENPDQIHRFWYDYKGIHNSFYFLIRYNGVTEFHHGYFCMNCIPLQKDIDTIYPVILAVEDAIQKQCGPADLKAKIKETCSGVRCSGA